MRLFSFFILFFSLISLTYSKSDTLVVILSIDGAKPSVVQAAKMPVMKKVVAEGAASWKAQTIHPSITLPSHVSMLTGLPPEKHKVLWNDWFKENGTLTMPTIFSVAKKENYKTAFFATKSKFKHFEVVGTLDKFFCETIPAQDLARNFINYFEANKPQLSFLHFHEVDQQGHKYGWGSPEQVAALEQVDVALGLLVASLKKLKQPYVLIVSADHGGTGKSHGSNSPEDMTIPWIAWGSKVKKNKTLQSSIKTMDTAATALYLLDIDVPVEWSATPVREAF